MLFAAALLLVQTLHTPDQTLVAVHTDRPSWLYLTRAHESDPERWCLHGDMKLVDANDYAEIPGWVPAHEPVRVCIYQQQGNRRIISPVFVAPPSSEGVAVVLIVRDQRVRVLQQPIPANKYAGIWPAALGDCHLTGSGWKPRCFAGLRTAGLSAQSVCAAESRFPDDGNRRLCFSVFGATDVTPPPNVSELAAIVSDANGLLADRQRALNQIRAQKLASAGPALLRVAQQQPSYAVHELQINAVVTLFELADARAPLAAKGLLSPASHDIDEKEELLLGLGRLNDASSLNVMADTLNCGRLYDELFAASALALRQEPEAETVLIQKFFDPNTEGDIFGAIWTHFAESDTDRGALALFEWAVPRRIVRDALTDIIKRWIAARGATAVTQLATFANSSNLGVARLAGGFLSRCTGQGLASDVAAWTAWASRQPPTYWTAVSKDPECSLPGVPEEGAPGDGSRYLELVQADRSFHTRGIPGPPLGHYDAYFRALKAPFWPYMLTVGHMCGPLGEGQGRNRARYLGRRDYVRLGETFSAGFDYEDFTALGGSWAKRIPCSSEDALADDEGELIFFVGEEKYRFRFRYKTLPYHPQPVP